jgi:hypothetical protein
MVLLKNYSNCLGIGVLLLHSYSLFIPKTLPEILLSRNLVSRSHEGPGKCNEIGIQYGELNESTIF